MKTLKRTRKYSAILLGSILSLLLGVSPLHGSDLPREDGVEINIEEWMILPFEMQAADYETELELEEWMIFPFEVQEAYYEAELELEEWMIFPFEVQEAYYEAELELEEWMSTAWN